MRFFLSPTGIFVFFFCIHSLLVASTNAFQQSKDTPKNHDGDRALGRRSFLIAPAITAMITTTAMPSHAATPNGITLNRSSVSNVKWADVKVGTGQALETGTVASIDYSMASTAGRFPQIYSTKDKGAPYRWTLGDGSTMKGLELAVLGNGDDVPPMLPGGIRRVIVPAELGYEALRAPSSACIAGTPGSVNPIPPKDAGDGAYQRFVQFYCNPRIPYQPDMVLDIKLYGKR